MKLTQITRILCLLMFLNFSSCNLNYHVEKLPDGYYLLMDFYGCKSCKTKASKYLKENKNKINDLKIIAYNYQNEKSVKMDLKDILFETVLFDKKEIHLGKFFYGKDCIAIYHVKDGKAQLFQSFC